MGDRVILHSDINCCYASIEHLHHPELAGKPLAVGGDPEARHGIVLTADYTAKKYGVKTGMALWQAKQVCPDITFVSPRMDLYLRFSRMAHQTLADVGTEWFSEAESRFLEKPDFTDCTQDTMQSLISEAEKSSVTEVQTNMGSMPIEDYREIVASQSGFDSYDEMYKQGYRIGNGYDKEPEPVVPAWEQKKKVKGFDLYPDVPMADRHTFNLRENEVETVGKKERLDKG